MQKKSLYFSCRLSVNTLYFNQIIIDVHVHWQKKVRTKKESIFRFGHFSNLIGFGFVFKSTSNLSAINIFHCLTIVDLPWSCCQLLDTGTGYWRVRTKGLALNHIQRNVSTKQRSWTLVQVATNELAKPNEETFAAEADCDYQWSTSIVLLFWWIASTQREMANQLYDTSFELLLASIGNQIALLKLTGNLSFATRLFISPFAASSTHFQCVVVDQL